MGAREREVERESACAGESERAPVLQHVSLLIIISVFRHQRPAQVCLGLYMCTRV
jgi:hypothetical protein